MAQLQTDMMSKLINLVFRDRGGHIVVWQWPNIPLAIWIVMKLVSYLLHGSAKTAAGLIGSAALVLWAVIEIGWGSSWFRRVLGAAVLLSILIATFGGLRS